MTPMLFLPLVASLVLSPNVAPATDLSKIERSIRKQPAYRSKPRYCLLVFGPEARTKIWLVQDGDVLYVDRNGSGDLTEPGKRVVSEKGEGADASGFVFKIGDVHDGPRLHKELTVYVAKIDHLAKQEESVKALLAKSPQARGYYVLVEMDMPGWKGTGIGGRVQQRAFFVDLQGVLQFSDRPQ